MRPLVVKLHIYAGLLVFTQFIIYGISGLTAAAHLQRPRTPQTVRYVPYTAPPAATDRDVAEDVYRTLNFTVARQPTNRTVRRTPENDLQIDLSNINGLRRVTVLERERRLRIEEARIPTAMFVNDMHTVHAGDAQAPRLMHAWGIYNGVAMWCLLAFCISGVYLWLSAQAGSLWAWICFGAGTIAFIALWATFR